MVIGFYSGIFTGFMRFFISVLFINITMFRVDKTGLPKWVYDVANLDLVNRAYNAFLKLYHTHNNPIILAFIGTIMDNVLEKRKRESIDKKNNKIKAKREVHRISDSQRRNKGSEESFRREVGHESNMKPLFPEKSLLVGNMLKRRKRFLKVAYRWQYYAFLVRNPALWEFKCSSEVSAKTNVNNAE
jgi:hypothetical protein